MINFNEEEEEERRRTKREEILGHSCFFVLVKARSPVPYVRAYLKRDQSLATVVRYFSSGIGKGEREKNKRHG